MHIYFSFQIYYHSVNSVSGGVCSEVSRLNVYSFTLLYYHIYFYHHHYYQTRKKIQQKSSKHSLKLKTFAESCDNY